MLEHTVQYILCVINLPAWYDIIPAKTIGGNIKICRVEEGVDARTKIKTLELIELERLFYSSDYI